MQYNGLYGGYLGPYGVLPPNVGNYSPNVAKAPMGQSNGILWVQGEEGAKAYPVPIGSTLLLMDSEEKRFFIKTTDASGIPMPLRTFEYTEKQAQTGGLSGSSNEVENMYITREEFESRLKEIESKQDASKKEAKNVKSSV